MSAEYVHLRLNCLPVVRRDAQGKKKTNYSFQTKEQIPHCTFLSAG